jgi:hypothetical protein
MGTIFDRPLVSRYRWVRVLAALPGDEDTKASFDEDVDIQEQEVLVGKRIDGAILLVLQQFSCLCDVRTPLS